MKLTALPLSAFCAAEEWLARLWCQWREHDWSPLPNRPGRFCFRCFRIEDAVPSIGGYRDRP